MKGALGWRFWSGDSTERAWTRIQSVPFKLLRCSGSPIPFYNRIAVPAKYLGFGASGGYSHFTVASGVEAQLITAEAALALHPDDPNWLTILNTLRRTVPGGLPPLTDPVDPKARLQLLFTERAEWLYLTGTRQGDLRRLLRTYKQYFPRQELVYPSGVYTATGAGVYGPDVVAPIPQAGAQRQPSHSGVPRQ